PGGQKTPRGRTSLPRYGGCLAEVAGRSCHLVISLPAHSQWVVGKRPDVDEGRPARRGGGVLSSCHPDLRQGNRTGPRERRALDQPQGAGADPIASVIRKGAPTAAPQTCTAFLSQHAAANDFSDSVC